MKNFILNLLLIFIGVSLFVIWGGVCVHLVLCALYANTLIGCIMSAAGAILIFSFGCASVEWFKEDCSDEDL